MRPEAKSFGEEDLGRTKMKQQFTAELKEGDNVESVFLVREKNLLDFRKKNGHYLHFLLADRSGEIEAKLWDNADEHDQLFHRGSFVNVKGKVVSYLDSLQIRIDDLYLVIDYEIDLTYFVALSDRPVQNMQEELVTNPYLTPYTHLSSF